MNEPDPRGLAVAERVTKFYLGSPRIAEEIIDAYLNPDWAEEVMNVVEAK